MASWSSLLWYQSQCEAAWGRCLEGHDFRLSGREFGKFLKQHNFLYPPMLKCQCQFDLRAYSWLHWPLQQVCTKPLKNAQQKHYKPRRMFHRCDPVFTAPPMLGCTLSRDMTWFSLRATAMTARDVIFLGFVVFCSKYFSRLAVALVLSLSRFISCSFTNHLRHSPDLTVRLKILTKNFNVHAVLFLFLLQFLKMSVSQKLHYKHSK